MLIPVLGDGRWERVSSVPSGKLLRLPDVSIPSTAAGFTRSAHPVFGGQGTGHLAWRRVIYTIEGSVRCH